MEACLEILVFPVEQSVGNGPIINLLYLSGLEPLLIVFFAFASFWGIATRRAFQINQIVVGVFVFADLLQLDMVFLKESILCMFLYQVEEAFQHFLIFILIIIILFSHVGLVLKNIPRAVFFLRRHGE